MSLYDETARCLQPEAYYAMQVQQYSMPQQHVHPRCEVMYVLSGTAAVEVAEQRYELSHGQYIFLDEGVPHSLRIDSPRGCGIMNIEFSCREAGGACRLEPARESCPAVRDFLKAKRPFFVASGRERFGYVMRDLVSQLERRQTADTRFLIGNLLTRLLCELAEGAAQREAGGLRYVRRAVAFMEEHYAGEIGVPEIAAAAGVGRSYLHALFQKEFGCGVAAYLGRMRINRAKFLLANTGMRLIDIACEVGYNSRQNFALAFQKQAGMSPSAFRRRSAASPPVRTGSFMRFPDEF